ncbi:MAG: pentapeptide repeat-containing protein [Chloroflexi bacterium]|nr:pentapeptide repeat-containing protein [Chloroflexota bacterium]MCY3583615.1 pentapeptide repeat-containing protein [Chloroflexota bacterium]MCY3715741.1 pentapeptide repeat-containing protein [Chloroflexota bacterium]MDE2651260.1 pentapeptide repeat-containing protein [Chloroflexota bacterium]MXX51820.1 pentapeptide repeat-containing protein [Chloroflexota bacterium]
MAALFPDTAMPLLYGVQRRLRRRWYALQPTDKLAAHLPLLTGAAAEAALHALQERLAHQDGSLRGVGWAGLNLPRAQMAAWQLQDADFAAANLPGGYFAYSQMAGANFRGANLRDAHFREAQLTGADFHGADLRQVNFARADLRAADLRDADMRGINLWGAKLDGAHFCADQLNTLRQMGMHLSAASE